MSKNFPSKFKNFKDFWSEEIFVGQTSLIYIQPEEFIEYFKKEIFEQRRYYFEPLINLEQYGALQSFSMAHLYINVHQRWKNDSVLAEILHKTIASFFKNDF